MTLDTHNLSSSAHQELHKIVKDEIFLIVNQLDTRVQNFEIQFLKEAAKFVRDSKSLAKEADESLAKNKALELEIEHLLRAVVSQDIMSVVQNNSVGDTSNLHTELERTKERFENCIIKKENEYTKLWNDWYKKCEACKFDKISYDKAYNEMHQKIERLQAQLGDLKGKSKDTSCVSDTLNHLSQKLENENVELEFQVLNYAKENAHLKTTYKNLFDSIFVTQTQTKTITDSLQNKLHDTIYENAKLRVQLFDKVDETHALSNPVPSNSIPTPQESKVMKNDKVIAPGMFRINPFKPSREEKYVPNKTTLRPKGHILGVIQRMIGSLSASKSSCSKNKEVEVEEHPRNLLLSKNKKHMSSECNNVKLATQNVKSKVVCAMWSIERLASPKPSKPRSFLRWSPTGRIFDLKGKIIASSELESQSDCSKGNNACTSNPLEPTIKWFPNSTFSLAGYPNMFMEHLCPSYEQGKSKRASHPPKPVPNSRQRSKDEAPEVIETFLKRINIRLQSPVIIIRTDNGSEFKNQTLVEATRTMLIFSRAPLFLWAEAIATACFTQNRSIIHRRFHKTPYELINGRKPDISFLHVFEALCYPKNDPEDIGKPGAKGDIGFFIGYSTDSCAYKVFNRRTKKIIETMNVTFDELSAMVFDQSSSNLGLQSMTSRQISSGLDLTYAPSTVTNQQPTKGKLNLLFEAMYDDYIGGQPSAAPRNVSAAQAHHVRQTSTKSTSIADTAPTPTNSSSQAKFFPNSSQDVDGLKSQQKHAHQQGNQAPLQPETVSDNVPNAMFDAN
nr:hypothetical protein [Tanacetum cinerariifolium]